MKPLPASFLAVAMAALIAGPLHAQTAPPPAQPPPPPADGTTPPPPRPHDMLGRLAKDLDLTDDQKEKLKPILKDEMDQIHAVREDASLSADDQKAKIKAIRDETRPKIAAVLTDDQKAKFAEMAQHERDHGGPPPPPPAPGGPAPTAAPAPAPAKS